MRAGAKISVLLSAALAAAGLVVPATALAAAPTTAPTLVAPAHGATVNGNPVLSWSPVDGALKYRVQVSASASFATMLYTADTVNLQATPPVDLPLNTIHWRVAATDGGTGIGPFAVASFVKEFANHPAPQSPADGAVLVYPTDAPTFRWAPLGGAAKYRLEIDDASDFVNPTSYVTPNTSFTLTSPQTGDQLFYWRVRGESSTANVVSDYSPARSYSYTWPQSADPQLLHPAPAAPGDPLPVIEDVVFRWSAVPGAASYELQVSPNGDWTNNPTTGFPVTVYGTSYSPPTTLADGSYHWRVRAKDTATPGANAGPWSSPSGQFVRAWNEPVTLLSPADGATVGVPTFRWTPRQANDALSTLATHYVVEVSTDTNFSPGTIASCTTYRTEWTPYDTTFPLSFIPTSPSTCTAQIVDGTTYWWRVRAVDGPRNVLGTLSAKRSFTYRKGGDNTLALLSPAHGAVVHSPVLKWTPVQDVHEYEVSIVGAATTKYKTHSTSFSPVLALPGTLPATFSWTVRPVDLKGNLGVAPGMRSFTVAAPTEPPSSITHLTPEDGEASPRMPSMTWTPVANAKKYRVWYSVGTSSNVYYMFSDAGEVPYAAFTHSKAILPAGSYRYYVEAIDSGNAVIATSPTRTFVISELVTPGGGSAPLLTPVNCVALPCVPAADTPTFTWSPVADAGYYLVYLATDSNFNNVLKTYQTEHPSLTPRESLPDNNAGQAYYWYVRPCKAESACMAFEPPHTGRSSFLKHSAPVEVVSPAYGAHVTGPVTFVWKDYLETNQARETPVTQEAKSYRFQASKVADFTSILDEKVVDQTTYTPYGIAYPEGPIYWRVVAIDASGNDLTYSRAPAGSLTEFHVITKDQPEVVQHETVPGSPTLTWDAQPFATGYDVEIYKNGDTAWAPGNLLTLGYSGATKVAGWTPTKALELGTYAWRVRRVDHGAGAVKNIDDWSVGRTFTVGVQSVPLVSPDDAAPVNDDKLLFDWDAVAGAASYKFESSTTSAFSTVIESVTTVMTEWANVKSYPGGTIHWRVTPLNADGKPLSSASTRTLRRVVEGDFFPLPPSRILDTRTGVGGTTGTVAGGSSIDVAVTGVGGVPETNVTAVVLNVTVTAPTASGFLTVWPSGAPRPTASNLNFVAGQTVPNLVKARVGQDGEVSIFNAAGQTHVLADVLGYYTDGVPAGGSTFTPLAPKRILDTRSTGGPIAGGASRELTVTGAGGVPATGVGAVVLNVTVVAPTATGFLTVYPNGQLRPNASNLNFTKGLTVANLVVAKVGAGGKVQLFNSSGATHALVDVAGWYTDGVQGTGTHFRALTPSRILDTRSTTPLAPGATRSIKVVGVGGVPASGVQAVVLNVTAVAPTSSGYLTVYPGGTRPVVSNLNFTAKRNVPNLVVAKVSGTSVTVFNSNGTTHVLFDVVGWYG